MSYGRLQPASTQLAAAPSATLEPTLTPESTEAVVSQPTPTTRQSAACPGETRPAGRVSRPNCALHGYPEPTKRYTKSFDVNPSK